MIVETLGRLAAGENLSPREMTATMDAVMDGQVSDEQIALLLTALAAKGETADELAGAAASLRKHMRRIHSRRTGIIDTCGTGGSGSKLFNISTAAALVTAAAGVPVAKHGNRAITSRSGSADVLAALGVDLVAEMNCVERCLDELGICFCFAPLAHPSVKRVAAVRAKLGKRTIFNLLGPLCNPAGAEFQLMGVPRSELRPTMARALAMLGTKRAAVVTGEGSLGEVTIAGATEVTEVAANGALKEYRWTPEEFGFARQSLKSLAIETAEQSAATIRRVLAGESGPARDIVVINAAAAIWIADGSETPSSSAKMAADAIDRGAARKLLDQLVELTNGGS
jgi:anthranilate phosphoribosyltransferase